MLLFHLHLDCHPFMCGTIKSERKRIELTYLRQFSTNIILYSPIFSWLFFVGISLKMCHQTRIQKQRMASYQQNSILKLDFLFPFSEHHHLWTRRITANLCVITSWCKHCLQNEGSYFLVVLRRTEECAVQFYPLGLIILDEYWVHLFS